MARVRVAVVLLSAVLVGAGALAVAHRAPTASVVTGPVTKPADPRSSGAAIAAVPGSVPKAPRTTGPTSPRPAVPPRFTGLHMTFPRTAHPVIYEVRGPQEPPVRLLCGACPADNSTHTSDARITLMEWNP